MNLGLSRIHYPVTTLGPGARLGIWVQGCSIHCPGCISVDTWQPSRQPTPVADILTQIKPYLEICDGVTISGGEPFEQWPALQELLKEIRNNSKCNILVYSGFPFSYLKTLLVSENNLIDIVISEPFQLAEPQTLALRGSDNQRMHFLTELGYATFSALDSKVSNSVRTLDLLVDDLGTAWIAGIPARGDMKKLQSLLKMEGHYSQITEAKK